jgi:hypothetical protein
MRTIKFFVIAVLIWFPVVSGLSIAADAVGIPDTDTWMWILRGAGVGMAACIAWMVVGAARATAIFQAVLPIIGLITNLICLLCFLLGAAAVVMILVKDWRWLDQHLYQPIMFPSIALSLFSLVPITILLMIFRKTRALGGIILYLLSFFLGFTLWFYSLMIVGSHGLFWIISGLLLIGVGVIFNAIVASALSGEWSIAGTILLIATLIWGAGMLGWFVAERQFEMDDDAERSAKPKCHDS